MRWLPFGDYTRRGFAPSTAAVRRAAPLDPPSRRGVEAHEALSLRALPLTAAPSRGAKAFKACVVDQSEKPGEREPSASPSSGSATSSKRPAPKKYPRERTFVAVVFFACAISWGLSGAVAIHADAFAPPPPDEAPAGTCADAIRSLHGSYVRALALNVASDEGATLRPRAPLQEPATVTELARLDRQLEGLRARCTAEGEGGATAHRALEVWRHQAEDVTRLSERVLTPDAQRALGYHSPATRSEGTRP